MTHESGPTIRLRRVGIELRRIRESAGLSVHEAGRLLNRSPSSISKYENGQVRLWNRELDRILDHYDVKDPALRRGDPHVRAQPHSRPAADRGVRPSRHHGGPAW
ncbi:helix-turn-helix domain-containing protein [Actinomadura sp. 9N407]|uniref:helix-turn-helix domain-containing protein n=1 Tax=Actinomadura sp. 9N407 TaxID=3375154 RepID=UPI0037A298AE